MIWITIALLVGLAAGWLLRRGGNTPSARVIEEVYGRKVRLAEQERHQAIVELNANRVEMTTFEERFAALDRRIAALSTDLLAAQTGRESAERVLGQRDTEVAALSAALEGARSTEALALIECAQAFVERDQASVAKDRAEDAMRARLSEVAGLEERLSALDQQERALREELEARAADLSGTRGDLARDSRELAAKTAEVGELRARLETLGEERRTMSSELDFRSGELSQARGEIARLGGEIELARQEVVRVKAELASAAALPGELGEARAELLRRADALAAQRAEADAGRARIAELEPLLGRVAALREELVERQRKHDAREVELEQVWKARQDTALQGKETELAEERRRSEERLERVHALNLELERTRDRVRELQGLGETHAAESGEMREERRRLEAEIDTAKAAATRADALLGERAGKIAELEGTLRGKEVQLKELARLPRDLEQAQGRVLKLEQELARSQVRGQELDVVVKTRDRELQEVRRDLARVGKELLASEAAREKGATALQERVAKLRELENALREKSTQMRDLESELRTRAAEQRTLQPQPRRTNDADDLQRIDGIGPVLAKKLQRLGLRTYKQIASLSKDEIESLARRLGTSSERIRREGWVTSARNALRE